MKYIDSFRDWQFKNWQDVPKASVVEKLNDLIDYCKELEKRIEKLEGR